MRAPPIPLGSPAARLKLVATLGHTSSSAPSKRRNQVQKKVYLRHFSPHFYAMFVSDVCTGIGKVTIKGILQAAKKVNIHGA